MLAVLVAIRDFLLATALAWVGLTVEQQVNTSERCGGGETCETQRDR